MNNGDCPRRHSSAALGKRVNIFCSYTAIMFGQVLQQDFIAEAAQCHISIVWVLANHRDWPQARSANTSTRTLRGTLSMWAEVAHWGFFSPTRVEEVCDCVLQRLTIWCERPPMCGLMITTADWWRRGDNYCVDDNDDECFTMMLMIITIVVLFLFFASISQPVEH